MIVDARRAALPARIAADLVIVGAGPAGITLALTLTLVSLIGYSAMVGAVGGGGLGDLGIRYGYQRFMPEVMASVVLVLILFVQGLQSLGDWLVRRVRRR